MKLERKASVGVYRARNNVCCYETAAETSQIFIPGDSRCTVLSSSDGQWMESRDNVTWSVVPCCFQEYTVNAVVCSARKLNFSNL